MNKLKKYHVLIILLFISLLTVKVKAEQSAKNLLLYGNSAAAFGRGGTGVSYYGIDLLYLNPASIASFERIGVGLQYGDLANKYIDPTVSFALPTSYGVLGATMRMITVPEQELDLTKAYSFSFGGAKQFSNKLSIGLMFTMVTAEDQTGTLYYPGGILGINYRVPLLLTSKSGFGIYEPRLGVSSIGGFSIAENEENIELNQVTAGYNFDFFRTKNFSIGLFNDISSSHNYTEFPVKYGIQSILYNKFILRAGGSAPNSYEYGDFTCGLGYRVDSQYFKADLDYALVHYPENDFVHYLGLNVNYGELDRVPPITKVVVTEKYISPNYDGTQDYTLFNINVKDRSKIKGWRLQILDQSDNVIREYKITERDVEDSLTPINFIKKIWQKKESQVVPEIIMWDGTDNNSNLVKDGFYKYEFISWDERDNYSITKRGNIVVDNLAPMIAVQVKDKLFSPNKDRKKDYLIIKHKVKRNAQDVWQAGFKDQTGKVVKSYNWKGNQVPSTLRWNGKNDSGEDLPEGLYQYFVTSKDKAGNKEKQLISEISLTRQYEVADITVKKEYFSFKYNKFLRFKPFISSRKGLQNWKVTIENSDQEIIKTFTAEDNLPDEIEWNVHDEKNKKLEDGKYYYKLETVFKSGNAPVSFKKEIIIDSTPPDIDLDFSPGLFSPDGDGSGDILTMTPEANDEFGIEKWQIDIINPTGYKFKSFSGVGQVSEEIMWDGLSDKNELVESANNYFIIYKAIDKAGNIAKTDKIKLPIDVLVVVTERGLKIRISNIQFAFDSAKLIGQAPKILNRVANILDRYDKYTVIVEGHTDDIGKEDYNLKLSEQRAETVYQYIISKGLNEERLTFRGMGETVPFIKNKDEETRRKNRRVEFILEKKSEK